MFERYSLLEVVRKAPGYAIKTVHRWAVRRYMRRYFDAHPDHPTRDRSAALSAVREADSILFLCWGNICRSPLAERYLTARLGNGDVDLTVESAGLGSRDGDPSPETAIETAAAYDVDLTDHRSERATDDQIRTSDVVFVMDENNYYTVSKRCPDALSSVFFLGALDDDERVPIADPHGHSVEQFETIYDRTTDAVDTLVAERERARE